MKDFFGPERERFIREAAGRASDEMLSLINLALAIQEYFREQPGSGERVTRAVKLAAIMARREEEILNSDLFHDMLLNFGRRQPMNLVEKEILTVIAHFAAKHLREFKAGKEKLCAWAETARWAEEHLRQRGWLPGPFKNVRNNSRASVPEPESILGIILANK